MVEVDRLMIEKYHISLLQMMENAGRCLAVLARVVFFGGNLQAKSILVLAGPGGNGGGALVAARRLANWGADVSVVLSHPETRLKSVTRQQLDILHAMEIEVTAASEVGARSLDLIIDGLIGYNLKGAPRGKSAELIIATNKNSAPVLALDIPSGLDADLGARHHPIIEANATLTLALPKVGLADSGAKSFVGALFCADISVPAQLYAEPALSVEPHQIFADSEMIHIK